MDPTLHGKKTAGSEDGGQMDEARKARRRLLKLGAASAPLVLTFRPSSAWANSGGCILHGGNKYIPGEITKVNRYFQPVVNYNSGIQYYQYYGQWWYRAYNRWYREDEGPYANRRYKKIYVNKSAGEPVTADNISHSRLRALVYNDNMGLSCLSSITAS